MVYVSVPRPTPSLVLEDTQAHGVAGLGGFEGVGNHVGKDADKQGAVGADQRIRILAVDVHDGPQLGKFGVEQGALDAHLVGQPEAHLPYLFDHLEVVAIAAVPVMLEQQQFTGSQEAGKDVIDVMEKGAFQGSPLFLGGGVLHEKQQVAVAVGGYRAGADQKTEVGFLTVVLGSDYAFFSIGTLVSRPKTMAMAAPQEGQCRVVPQAKGAPGIGNTQRVEEGIIDRQDLPGAVEHREDSAHGMHHPSITGLLLTRAMSIQFFRGGPFCRGEVGFHAASSVGFARL